ncbi:MAG: STAS domain-containing protein [Candidatus Sericytochromatia bacterium]|nr:STAS domain-containing protein [Candidatus Tanganyikabacteria bacterium]
MALTVSQKAVESVQVITLAGEIDAQTLPPLETALQDLVDNGHYRIVLDFRQVPFIASAGLGVLMSVIGTIQDNGGDLVIAGAQPDVYRTFDLLDFTTLFKFTESVDQAVAVFGGPVGLRGE